MIPYSMIHWDLRSGNGTIDSDNATIYGPRCCRNERRFVAMHQLRVHFSAGSTDATLTVSLDHWHSPSFDTTLLVFENAGNGADNGDIAMSFGIDDLNAFTLKNHEDDGAARDALLFSWTGASDDTWGIEIGWVDAEKIQ